MAFILGFSAYSSPRKTGVGTFRVPGTNTTLPVRREVAPLLIGFAHEFDQTVEPLRTGWNWGYAYRAIRGLFSPSRHSAGIAIDLNAPRHPLGKRGTFTPRQVRQIRTLCNKYGLRWGGDYRKRADEMHFEINEPRDAALRRVHRLQSPVSKPTPTNPVAPPPPSHSHATPALKKGMHDRSLPNSPISDLQGHLNAWRAHRSMPKIRVDGDFGSTTDTCVRHFQGHHGVKVDGIVGPTTWRLIHQHSNGKRA